MIISLIRPEGTWRGDLDVLIHLVFLASSMMPGVSVYLPGRRKVNVTQKICRGLMGFSEGQNIMLGLLLRAFALSGIKKMFLPIRVTHSPGMDGVGSRTGVSICSTFSIKTFC